MGKTIYLVPLSGGLDSTYMLLKLMNEGKDVFPFHVKIYNSFEDKVDKEIDAVENITKWFKCAFYHDFRVHFTTYEHYQAGQGRDTEAIYLSAIKHAYQLIKLDEVDHVVLCEGLVMDDLQYPEYQKRYDDKLDERLYKAFIDGMEYRVPYEQLNKMCHKIYYPLIDEDVHKYTMLKNMPYNLKMLVWYCRTGKAEPCGKCLSCIIHKSVEKDIASS